jgi:ABC-type transporter Mla MlaB component
MTLPAFSYYMHDGPTAFSIELAGALAAEDAEKLEQDWLSASAAIGEKELVVDLSFVTEIDSVGRELLLRWRRKGATVVANTLDSRALAESVIGSPVPPIARIAYTSTPYRSSPCTFIPSRSGTPSPRPHPSGGSDPADGSTGLAGPKPQPTLLQLKR